jgi:hypothetical protein
MRFCFTRPAAVLLILGLAACTRDGKAPQPKPAPAPAASTVVAAPAAPAPAPALAQEPVRDREKERALMQAIFGESYDLEAGNALAIIEDEGEEEYFLMTLADFSELPDGRIVVVVNGAPSGENREEASSHVSPGMLNVYVLQPRDTGGWRLVGRHQNVDKLGSSGHFGDVKWIDLGAGKTGFIVSSGGIWQGHVMSTASIYEFGEGVRALGGFSESSSNDGACVPGVEDCWDVDSSIRFADDPQGGAYRDILVDFKGRHYTVTEDKSGKDVEHLRSTVQQSARYRFDGKAYVLVSGANPVPGF